MIDSVQEKLLESEQATLDLGARLGQQLLHHGHSARDGVQIHLVGGLGAGKTTVVRGLLHGLGVIGPVKSPTYTLVEPYLIQGLSINHFDLYRLGEPDELEFIGYGDYCHPGSVCCVEWPERGYGWLPEADLVIHLQASPQAHRVRFQACSSLGSELID